MGHGARRSHLRSGKHLNPAGPAEFAQLPVTVIGGYLGTGKTTLVNRLLRDANGLRLAVLVNEFGELPIDSDLIEAQDENVISIAGGCVCCSYGNDLIMAMLDLAKMAPRPDHVLLEASGVALPGAIASSIGLLQDYVCDGVVVLADAETVRERCTDRYLSDTVERQLDDADIVIINKVDLVSEQSADATHNWLTDKFPRTKMVSATHAAVPPEVVLQSFLGRELSAPGKLSTTHAPHQMDHFESCSIRFDGVNDAALLAKRLTESGFGVVRAKGFVRTADGSFMSVQIVGHRWQVAPSGKPAQMGIVCIGLRGQFSRQALLQLAGDYF